MDKYNLRPIFWTMCGYMGTWVWVILNHTRTRYTQWVLNFPICVSMGIFLTHTLALIGFLPTGYAGNGYPLPSLKARSSSSSVRTGTSLHGSLLTCQVYRGNLLSTLLTSIPSLNRSGSFSAASMKKGARLLVRS